MSDDTRKRRLATCQHFHGIQHACPKGVDRATVRGTGPFALACTRLDPHWSRGGSPTCPQYDATTPEMVDAEERDEREAWEAIGRGVSPCCGAAIDERHVRSGSGPRYCSKCGKLVFSSCNAGGEP